MSRCKTGNSCIKGQFRLAKYLKKRLQITHHTSHLTPHTSPLTPHTSHLTPHTSHLLTLHVVEPISDLMSSSVLFAPGLQAALLTFAAHQVGLHVPAKRGHNILKALPSQLR